MGIILRTDAQSFINNLQSRNNPSKQQVSSISYVYTKAVPDEEIEQRLYKYFTKDTYYNNKSYAKILQKKK